MSETKLDYTKAIRDLHGCGSDFCAAVWVREEFDDALVWEGVVMVYALRRHPEARTCFAWATPVPGTSRVEYVAVLLKPPIASAEDAVRAYVASRARS